MSPTNSPTQPKFIMEDVNLLFNDLTTPETGVKFNPPSRANPATIQNDISPPIITWTWADQSARNAENVTQGDVGKYGLQTDANSLYRLTSATPSPTVWQPVPTGTTATWTWADATAHSNQTVTQDDVGKIGIQTDINTLYLLTSATPVVWQPVPNPANTSSPFELSTGASDAIAYHDFFRLQIAFEDVWAELLDQKIGPMAQLLYGQWDALYGQWDAPMDQNLDDTGATDRVRTFDPLPQPSNGSKPPTISGAEELQNFLNYLKIQLGIGSSGTSDTPAEITKLKNDLSQTIQGCIMLLNEINRVGLGGQLGKWTNDNWLIETYVSSQGAQNPSQTADLAAFPDVQRQHVFDTILTDVQNLSIATQGTASGSSNQGTASTSSNQGTASGSSDQGITTQEITSILSSLDTMLKESYRFDVFAPDSINYGLLLNYRQRWQPQSYQVGNLVSTIPLAPQETRRYTTKTVIKKKRNVKEIDDSLRSGKDESSDTFRVDSEIVDRAKNQTNFKKTASGSIDAGMYKVSAGMQQGQDQAVESAQTKREFHESVVKSAQEYRNEHRLEITTEESREDETTSYQEIRNPNDELTVTYLFYELQRRYLVDEELHKVTPVILVANDVPAPHEVDQAWILRHDWIIKRTILDDSFLPALEYLSANYTGEEVTLQVLGLAVEQQKAVVNNISQQVQLANTYLDAATSSLETTENQEVQGLQNAETMSQVRAIFDPLGLTKSGTDGNSDRARVDFAKDVMNRAQTKVNQLVGDLKKETTALQVAIDKYTAAATKHFSMLADIDRLRVHVKDNIIYYMQAIWTYEPADQRYFRLYNLDVPVFTHNTRMPSSPTEGLSQIDNSSTSYHVTFPPPTPVDATLKLYQVADIENLIGFKGNYMIFPMVNFNYMTWFMMQDYLHLDGPTGVTAQDPDPLAGLSIESMKAAMASIYARDPKSFEDPMTVTLKDPTTKTVTTKTVTKQAIFEEIMLQLLSTQNPEMVIVPSKSLYIEALPGTHPLLEDFKLIHRAIDVKKAQAEARHAELENLRLAARLAAGEYGGPVGKVVVVESGQNVTVDAGE